MGADSLNTAGYIAAKGQPFFATTVGNRPVFLLASCRKSGLQDAVGTNSLGTRLKTAPAERALRIVGGRGFPLASRDLLLMGCYLL